MKVTTISREVKTIETKQVIFDNGVTCKYTITNGVFSLHSIRNANNKQLNVCINDTDAIIQHTFANIRKLFTAVHLLVTTEDELFNLNLDNLYQYEASGGLLYGQDGKLVNMATQLTCVDIYSRVKNDKVTMQKYHKFIMDLDFVTVIKNGQIKEIYEQDDELDYDQYDIVDMIVAVDYDRYVKYVGKNKFFERDALIREFVALFIAQNADCKKEGW